MAPRKPSGSAAATDTNAPSPSGAGASGPPTKPPASGQKALELASSSQKARVAPRCFLAAAIAILSLSVGRTPATLALADGVHETVDDAASMGRADLSPGIVDAIAQQLVQSFDGAHGGFGQGPKFPAEGPITLGLRLYAEHGDRRMLGIVTKTLDEMARGAIHDHVGGGFHRYAVDRAWQVPNFDPSGLV